MMMGVAGKGFVVGLGVRYEGGRRQIVVRVVRTGVTRGGQARGQVLLG